MATRPVGIECSTVSASVFWIATSWLATGLFIGPMVAVLLTLSLEIYLNEGRIQSVEPARSS